jgi:ABC-type hemin transport system ATPase subunit
VDAVQRAAVEDVLSEGEQTAPGLAGFLTEVESDGSQSASVFDDPVTSLDHVRQEKVAERGLPAAREDSNMSTRRSPKLRYRRG